MHELSIALSILDLVAEEAAAACCATSRTGRVAAVHLKLGPLSGVAREALVSAFYLAREGTPYEQAELVVEDVPVTVHCPACDAERDLPSVQELRCPVCGVPTPAIVRGRELEVVALEIEP
jgi:hydrogenase nickel incorporation protein HypA/HybF